MEIKIIETGYGVIKAILTEQLFGSSDTVSGSLRNLAEEIEIHSKRFKEREDFDDALNVINKTNISASNSRARSINSLGDTCKSESLGKANLSTRQYDEQLKEQVQVK